MKTIIKFLVSISMLCVFIMCEPSSEKTVEKFSGQSLDTSKSNGALVFKNNCAICHQAPFEDSNGPGLRSFFRKQITNLEAAKELLIHDTVSYHSKWKNDLNSEQIDSVLLFCIEAAK